MAKTLSQLKPASADDAAPRLDLGGLDDLVGFHQRMAMIAVYRNFTQHLQPLDLTQKQAGVLWLIAANGGVSQITLANAVLMDRASMMAIIDRLENRGLIIRRKSASDGRKQELYLTPKGRQLTAQSKAAVGKCEAWIKSHFATQPELDAFVAALKRIHG